MRPKQELSLRLAQKIILTPTLQQAIKLLQLSRFELTEEVAHELEKNPALEERAGESEPQEQATTDNAEDGDFLNYIKEYWNDDANRSRVPRESRELPSFENYVARPHRLSDHMMWQLGASVDNETDREIGQAIVGNLDEHGRLDATVEELAEMGPFPLQRVEELLHRIQRFDPPGVAARDLSECLLIQLELMGEDDSAAATIVREMLPELRARKYEEIAKRLQLTVEDVVEEVRIIEGLEPHPGESHNADSSHYVQPDVYVYKRDGEYVCELNDDGQPRLRLSPQFRNLLKQIESANGRQPKETRRYFDEQVKAAQQFLRSIEERKKTIMKVARSIVVHQRRFLDHGIHELKPMVLRDVAEDIGMHESTVSRVVNRKYMHTPRGLFEMRYFFHSGISSSSGQDVSSHAVKEVIKKLVSEEDPMKPLSDAAIASILKSDHGLAIARRTVAKYREEISIPSSSARKQAHRARQHHAR